MIPEVLRGTFVLANSARTQTILHDRLCTEGIENSAYVEWELIGVISFIHKITQTPTDTMTGSCSLFARSGIGFSTPVCAIIFGSYLAFSVCVLEIHWNEGFSSLQSFNFKNFCRMRIDRKSGDLEVFAIGLEKTWNKWTADRRRNKNLYPSRWRLSKTKKRETKNCED